MQEITKQGDYYGLPEQVREAAPAPEKIAEQLKAPSPWQGPATVEYSE